LSGRDEQAQYELREVRALLDWLDNARTYGRITITVRLSRGAPKPASAGRSKPASALTMHIPHRFDSVQHSLELLVSNQDA
jgi:hypothetical protein